MKRLRLSRSVSIIIVSYLLFWNIFPIVSFASFITPGEPIKPGNSIAPGNPIKPGDPISGGEFIAPGQVYDPGNPYQPGDSVNSGDNLNSGQPIIEAHPITGGSFIIPNAPPRVPTVNFGGSTITSGNSIVTGDGLVGGNGSNSGDAINGGNTSSNGNAIEGGNSTNGNTSSGGNPIISGEVDVNGNPVTSGNSTSDGNAINGGNATNGNSNSGGDPINGGALDENGNPVNGGNTTNNGNAVNGGNASNSGNGVNGGNASNSGNGVNGGNTSNSGNANNGNTINGGNPTQGNSNNAGNTQSPPDFKDTIPGQIVEAIKNTKEYIIDFGDNFTQGMVATYAGFDFRELDGGYYSVLGKNQLNNVTTDWFYDRYRQYTYNGEDAQFGPNSRRIGEGRYNAFYTSKNLDGNIRAHVSSALNNEWNIASRDYWKPSNMLKLGGPTNIVLSGAEPFYNHTNGFQDLSGVATTSFAADMTTEVAIGVGTTAASSLVSSIAAGAVAGSAVPGLGTVVGAIAGLGTGLLINYGINGTSWGRRAKEATTKFIKNRYDDVVSFTKDTYKKAKDGLNKAKDFAKSAVSKIGEKVGNLFGF